MKKIFLAVLAASTAFAVFCVAPVAAVDCGAFDASDPDQKQEAANQGCDMICLKNSGFDPDQQKAAGCNIDDPGSDAFSTVRIALNSVYFAVTIAAVGVIIFGGFRYSLSQGDPGKVKKAKDTIMYAIIGLIVVLSAFAITNFILSIIQQ